MNNVFKFIKRHPIKLYTLYTIPLIIHVNYAHHPGLISRFYLSLLTCVNPLFHPVVYLNIYKNGFIFNKK